MIDVWCFSNLEKVELFLNGKSFGTQAVERDSHVAWKVSYEPGVLEAKGYRAGKLILTARRETTGPPAKIILQPMRVQLAANGEDVSVVEVWVADSEGRVVPDAGNLVSFEISGPGRIIGVGNGDPSCHEPDKAKERSAFNGLCCALVQSLKKAGQIKLQASSPGLESATVTLEAQPAAPRPAVA